MKAVILQSGYMPWLGYFNMIDQADVFVFLDDVQWTTRDWRNRNRIRTPQGWSWLTVPVKLERTYFEYSIKDVEVDSSQNWQKRHLDTLRNCYRKAPYFDEVYPIFESVLNAKQKFVVDLNYELIFKICNYIELKKTRFLFSQEMGIFRDVKKTEKLLGLLEEIGGIGTYLSGLSAKSYLEEEKFEGCGIKVEWHDYDHPYYYQNTWGSHVFIPYLSIADLLFNHGKESLGILSGRKIIDRPENIQIVMPDDYRKVIKK
jgi:hypothetical protein